MELGSEELREQLTQLYDKDAGWLIGVDLTLFQVMRLAVVFAEATSVYGVLIGFVDQAPEVLKGFQFQILYKKINDSVGVYKVVLELPDQLRSQQFGAVGFTIPTIKIDVFTNGDFRLDIGFPDGLDFSNSFNVQAQAGPIPVIGFGGFFFAKLSSATSSTPSAGSARNWMRAPWPGVHGAPRRKHAPAARGISDRHAGTRAISAMRRRNWRHCRR